MWRVGDARRFRWAWGRGEERSPWRASAGADDWSLITTEPSPGGQTGGRREQAVLDPPVPEGTARVVVVAWDGRTIRACEARLDSDRTPILLPGTAAPVEVRVIVSFDRDGNTTGLFAAG